MKPTQSKDSIAPWFVAAEAVGEYIGIRFGRIPPGETSPEWIFLRHTDVDGIGGFAKILRERGVDLPVLPQIHHPADPSWLSPLKLIRKMAKPQRRIAWAPMDKGSSIAAADSEGPPAVAWHVFTEDSTTQIKRICRKTQVTVNSFLLKSLTKAIRPFLKDHASDVPWMIPVNLRGKISQPEDTGNHSSYVGVRIKSFETVADVHAKIYAALNQGDHWANWSGYGLGCILTDKLRQNLVASGKCMSQWNLGSFSNLGAWDSDNEISNPSCDGSWLFTPPVLRCQHLGIGCVTFKNRMSLTIQAHSDLTTNPDVPKEWIKSWVKEIEMDLVSVLSSSSNIPIIAA